MFMPAELCKGLLPVAIKAKFLHTIQLRGLCVQLTVHI